VAAAAATAVAAAGAARGYGYEVAVVADGALPRGLLVVLVADLHVHGAVPRWVVEQVARLRPDVLLVAGDSWDELSPWPPRPAVEALRAMAGAAGEAYAVPGNHEYAAARRRGEDPLSATRRLYAEAGVRLLADEAVEASSGLRVCGVDWRDEPAGYADAASMARREGCRIVLSHSPDVFHYADPGFGALYLAGHTHGGQVCLPGAVSLFTNSRFGYRWGLYRRGAARLYVSRGLGEMLPPRLYCSRQLVAVRGANRGRGAGMEA